MEDRDAHHTVWQPQQVWIVGASMQNAPFFQLLLMEYGLSYQRITGMQKEIYAQIWMVCKFIYTTLSWFVVKNALIPCNGAPTGNRKSSSAVEN